MPSPTVTWARIAFASLFFCGALGCAYYNTFYLAKKYYNQAEKTAERAGSDKLPPDAVKKYDDAIRQASKVLAYHGGSRWVDDAVYLMGASMYGKRDYEGALKKFNELLVNYPKSDFVPWAHYMSGLCHFQRRDYEAMALSFHNVLTGYPKFQRRDDILYTEARAAEIQRDLPEAVRRYRDLVDQYPKSPRSEEGLLRIGDLYFDAGKADSAYASYSELARKAQNDETYREAQIKAADALIRLDRAEAAVDLLGDLVPKQDAQVIVTDEGPPRTFIALAKAYNSLGQHREAIEALRTVTGKYTASTSAAEAQFQIGYTYEVYLDSLEAARREYDAAATMSSRSVFKEQAAQRSRNLQQIQSLATEASGDSAKGEDTQAEAALRMAELYLFSQDRPTDALETYRGVIRAYPESRLAARAAYAIAWIQLKELEGTRDSALASFARVIRAYPASTQARAALERLVEEDADTTGLSGLLQEVAADTTAAVPGQAPGAGGAGRSSEPGASAGATGDAGRPGRVPAPPESAAAAFDSLRRGTAPPGFLQPPAGEPDALRHEAGEGPASGPAPVVSTEEEIPSGAAPDSAPAPADEPPAGQGGEREP